MHWLSTMSSSHTPVTKSEIQAICTSWEIAFTKTSISHIFLRKNMGIRWATGINLPPHAVRMQFWVCFWSILRKRNDKKPPSQTPSQFASQPISKICAIFTLPAFTVCSRRRGHSMLSLVTSLRHLYSKLTNDKWALMIMAAPSARHQCQLKSIESKTNLTYLRTYMYRHTQTISILSASGHSEKIMLSTNVKLLHNEQYQSHLTLRSGNARTIAYRIVEICGRYSTGYDSKLVHKVNSGYSYST